MTDAGIPTFQHYLLPTLDALKTLGGSATNAELYETVAKALALTDEQLDVLHNPERGNETEVGYRMSWARTYLKKVDLIENSARGVWTLSDKGKAAKGLNPTEIVRRVRKAAPLADSSSIDPNDPEDVVPDWCDELLDVLKNIEPEQFERLCQRILRESGFVEVHVTGRSGDGGIDGTGILSPS